MENLPFLVDDDILEDKDIAWGVYRLCLNSLDSHSGMRTEHLRHWMIDTTRDDLPDATNWLKVFTIMQEPFSKGTMDEECMWQTVILIPKGKGGFWGIGFVEVL